MRTIASMFIYVVMCGVAWGAEPVISVKLQVTADDSVGQRLVYWIKEGLRRSSRLDLTDDQKPGLKISIVTLDGDRSSPGNYTVYSAVWSWNNPEQLFPFYLTSSVGTCGSNRVQACAEGLVADTDEQASQMTQLFNAIRNATSTKR